MIVMFNEFFNLTAGHDMCRAISRIEHMSRSMASAMLHYILMHHDLKKNCIVFTHLGGYMRPLHMAVSWEAREALIEVTRPTWTHFPTGPFSSQFIILVGFILNYCLLAM